MERIPLPVPQGVTEEQGITIIEQAIARLGLVIALRTRLKSQSNALHWHIRRPHTGGTLEITYDPDVPQAWFSTRAGRTKEWVWEAMNMLTAELNR